MEAFQLRLWDGRIGRWLSPDPYGQYASPYLGMGNNPVNMIDPDGGFTEEPGPGKGFFGRLFSSIGSIFSSESQEITYDEGTLKEVIVKSRPKSTYVSSGAYGWNDGSAESLWNDFMPVTSSFNTFYTGAKTGNRSEMAFGAAFLVIDIVSFGEGSIAIKGVEGVEQTAKFSIRSARKRAVRQAWKMEKELVEATGEGTRNWSLKQLKQLKETGKVSGFVGHHINSVKGYPLLAGLPNNIEFVTRQEHIIKHFGNFRNTTFGELISRGF